MCGNLLKKQDKTKWFETLKRNNPEKWKIAVKEFVKAVT